MAAFTIENTLRPCIVKLGNGPHKALFHGIWQHVRTYTSTHTTASPEAIVELEDGRVIAVSPTNITFVDRKIEEYSFGEEREDDQT